jgi:hypothetical protein
LTSAIIFPGLTTCPSKETGRKPPFTISTAICQCWPNTGFIHGPRGGRGGHPVDGHAGVLLVGHPSGFFRFASGVGDRASQA